MQKFAIMRSNCRLELAKIHKWIYGGFPRDNDLLFYVISKKKTSNLLARFCGTFEVGGGGGGGGVIVIFSDALIVRQLFLYERRDKKS